VQDERRLRQAREGGAEDADQAPEERASGSEPSSLSPNQHAIRRAARSRRPRRTCSALASCRGPLEPPARSLGLTHPPRAVRGGQRARPGAQRDHGEDQDPLQELRRAGPAVRR
jgi:hypothetical protein